MSEITYAHGAQASRDVSREDAIVGDSAVNQAPMGSLAPTPLGGVLPLRQNTVTKAGHDSIFIKPALSPARVEDFNSEAEIPSFELSNIQHRLMMASVEMAAIGNEIVDVISMIYEGSRVQLAQQAEAFQKAAKAAIDQATEAAKAGILGKIFGWIGKIFAIIFLTLTSIALAPTSPALAALTMTALALTMMDFYSAISQECGGPDISFAGLVALCAQAAHATQSTVDGIRQWLGLSVQILTVILGAAGSGAAAAKMSEMLGKTLEAGLKLASGLTAMGAGAASVYKGAENYKLTLAQVEEMGAQSYHEQLSRIVKQWGEDLLGFKQWVDDSLVQRIDMGNREHKSNMRILEN